MSKKYILWLTMALIFFIVCSVVITYIEEQAVTANFVDRSTVNTNQYGYAAYFKILKEAQLNPQVYQSNFKNIKSIAGTMVMVDPQPISVKNRPVYIGGEDYDSLLDWIKDGNNLILIDHFTYYFSRQLLSRMSININPSQYNQGNPLELEFYTEDFDSEAVAKDFSKYFHITDPDSYLLSQVDSIVLQSNVRLKDQFIGSILSDEDGVMVAYRRYGKGNVIILTDTSFGENTVLFKEHNNNYQFLTNLITLFDQPVYFNEYVHGYTNSAPPANIFMKSPLWSIFYQIVLITLILVISISRRFGSPIPYNEKRLKATMTYIHAISTLYQKANLQKETLATIFIDFKKRVSKKSLTSAQNTDNTKFKEVVTNLYDQKTSAKLIEIVEWYENIIQSQRSFKPKEVIKLVNEMHRCM